MEIMGVNFNYVSDYDLTHGNCNRSHNEMKALYLNFSHETK